MSNQGMRFSRGGGSQSQTLIPPKPRGQNCCVTMCGLCSVLSPKEDSWAYCPTWPRMCSDEKKHKLVEVRM